VINFWQLSTLPHYASGTFKITGSYLFRVFYQQQKHLLQSFSR